MRNLPSLCILLAASLCSAQAPATTPAPTTTKYHNDAMNFDFIYPSSFHERKGTTDEERKKNNVDIGCVSLPIAVMDMRTSFNMILLKHFDQACLDKKTSPAKLSATATAFLTDSLYQFGNAAVNPSTEYEIADHDASLVSGSVKVPNSKGNNIIHGATGCVASGKDTACFLFISNECPNLAGLAASTIQFKDAAATPVIPTKLDLACKP